MLFETWTPAPPTISPTPNGSETATPTPLPTKSPTPADTLTPTEAPLPTGLPTQSFETATLVVLPATLSAAAARGLIVIIYVDKELEYVDIQNAGLPPVNIKGWKLVSEVGNQTCYLTGILQPKAVLRIWSGRNHPTGLNCGFYHLIWADNEIDPAVLYNANGEEVSRYPKP
ncbi:MAG: lamin tail domain-containing protein [Chloroflexota bacterium]